jgi:hypothetical protein
VSRTRSSGLALVAVCAAAPAARAEPIAIHVTGTVPFSEAELASALAARAQLAAAGAPALDARVTGDALAIDLDVGGHTRRLALDGQTGQDAARLVAFAILDLSIDQLAPPVARDGGAVFAHALPAPPRAVAWSVAAWGSAGTRDETTLELGVRIAGRVRAIGSLGAGLSETTTANGKSVALRGFPVRIGAAWRAGSIELRATAIAVAEQASATHSSTDVIAGGGVAAAYAVDLHHATVLVGAGVDGFATQLDYKVDGMAVTSTARLGWWGGVAVAREVWR